MAASRIICGAEDIRAGVEALVRVCPHMARIHRAVGDPPLRRRGNDFAGLARIIVGQQLSVASASAIWDRLAVALGDIRAKEVRAASDEALRAAGLSAGKVRTLRALTEAIRGGELSLEALDEANDADIRAALTKVKGIGPWTADVYVMFCLGRADAWASGDLALRSATAIAMDLETPPAAGELEEIAERWRPWRGVAARLLWAYYGAVKAGQAADPV